MWGVLTAAAAAANVKELDEASFDELVTSSDYDLVLVEFFAPWCGHCKKLAPAYEAAATTLAGTRIALASVDATAHQDLGNRFNVQGYPTLIIFRGSADAREQYEGPRDADGIVSYLKRVSGPAMRPAHSAADVQAAVTEAAGGLVVVAYGDAGNAAVKVVESFANTHRTHAVFVHAPASAGSGVVAFPAGGGESAALAGEVTATSVADFVNLHRFLPVAEITQANYRDYKERSLPLAWAFVDTASELALAEAKAELEVLAAGHLGKLSVVYLSGRDYASMAQRLGLSGTTMPSLTIEDAQDRHYAYDESAEFKGAALAAWAKRVLAGEVGATVRSQDAPAEPVDEHGVTTLVGSTLAATLESGKDVIVEFYAPWCGHCKGLVPEWNSLGELAQKAAGGDVVVAKFDHTANDISAPGMQVQSYPTIYFKPGAAGSAPIKYDGGRTAKDFAAFIARHGSSAGAQAMDEAADQEL